MIASLSPTEVRAHLGEWHRGRDVLYDGLADALEDLIRRGVLPPHTRLPAERRLAEALHLSRSTVKAAYDTLQERGVVETRHGSGSAILPDVSPLSGPREAQVLSSFDPESIYGAVLRLDRDALDLRGAYWVGPECVTEDVVAAAYRDLAAMTDAHGYLALGVPALREAVADHLTRTGLATTSDQVMITTGAQQAITLIADLLLAPGDSVAVEALTFPSAMDYVASRQARLEPVPFSTDLGVDVGALDRVVRTRQPRMTYLITSVHNPTGAVLPGPARFRLAELAAEWDTTLVDDRTLADIQFVGTPPTPLTALVEEHARPDRILTVGSMSKLTWGGLRIGWIRGTVDAIQRIGRIKVLSDLGTPVLDQLVATHLLHDEGLVDRRRTELRARYEAFRAAMATHVPEWEVTDPKGGLCLWAHLPGADTREFARHAVQHGVGIASGTVSSATRGHSDHLRLPFGQPVDVSEEALRRLAAAWDAYRDRRGREMDPTAAVV